MRSFPLTTPRLRLRPFTAAELPALVAYRSDPEIARYQGWEPTFTAADAERFPGRIAARRAAPPR
jgi:RimJ/RimL family protein N-acetyltransferase